MTTTAIAQPAHLEYWTKQLPEFKSTYTTASPYPHIVLENFLPDNIINACYTDFNTLSETNGWINYVHFNERKKGLNKTEAIPLNLRNAIQYLNSPEFVKFLSELTGIPGLIADDQLEGGGLHQSTRGGFLNIHADFTAHPHHQNWSRRVNILIYLNKDWDENWGGHLELWDREMKACVEKIAPLFNRCVIFNTDADSYHGHPEPMTCPEGKFRRSIALYYYTQEENPYRHATLYKARPADGAKSILIRADSMLVSLYTAIKSRLGSNDTFISNLLNKLFTGKKN